jgi:hypothetical protein
MLQHVLTVGNNELAVRDDDDASEEVAKGGQVQVSLGNSCGWISRDIRQACSNFLLTVGTER